MKGQYEGYVVDALSDEDKVHSNTQSVFAHVWCCELPQVSGCLIDEHNASTLQHLTQPQ